MGSVMPRFHYCFFSTGIKCHIMISHHYNLVVPSPTTYFHVILIDFFLHSSFTENTNHRVRWKSNQTTNSKFCFAYLFVFFVLLFIVNSRNIFCVY